MSTCIFSRAFYARSLDSSICSGINGLAPAAGSRRLHPVAQRLLDQAQLLGRHHDAHRLSILDRLLLELGCVFLLRGLLQTEFGLVFAQGPLRRALVDGQLVHGVRLN